MLSLNYFTNLKIGKSLLITKVSIYSLYYTLHKKNVVHKI